MPLFCPACTSELDPSATACGICLRGRSRQEIFRGMRQLQEEANTARRRPWLIVGGAVFLAAASLAAYRLRGLLPVEASVPPVPPIVRPAPTTSPAPILTPAANLYSTALPAKYRRAGARRSTGNNSRWTVSGRAYELITLKAVVGAHLTFTDKSNGKSFKTVTQADGSYEVRLPRSEEQGYQLRVRHKNSRPGYLDEMEPSYDRQSRARRLEAAQLINQTTVLHVPLLPPENGDSLVYNIVLLAR